MPEVEKLTLRTSWLMDASGTSTMLRVVMSIECNSILRTVSSSADTVNDIIMNVAKNNDFFIRLHFLFLQMNEKKT